MPQPGQYIQLWVLSISLPPQNHPFVIMWWAQACEEGYVDIGKHDMRIDFLVQPRSRFTRRLSSTGTRRATIVGPSGVSSKVSEYSRIVMLPDAVLWSDGQSSRQCDDSLMFWEVYEAMIGRQ
jgi:hypothetical protein